MWIRSQDRKSLLEIEDVEIDSINQVWGIDKLLGKCLKYDNCTEYCLEKVDERIKNKNDR